MKRTPTRLAVAMAVAIAACGGSATGPDGGSDARDAANDSAADRVNGSDGADIAEAGGETGDGTSADGGSCVPPKLGRAASWSRTHPMFISGLVVVMGTPTPSAVADYFDVFNANALHLWASGLPTELGAWAAVGRPSLPYVSWTEKDGTSIDGGKLIGGAPPKADRIGYQIGDEPPDLATLKEMEAAAKKVRAADPESLIILNFAPSTSDELFAYAEKIPEFDVFSMDNYTYGKGAYSFLGKVRASALASGKSYWRYLDGYREKGKSDSTTESDVRWDAYVGAAYGYTGHTWFLYQIEGTNPDLEPLGFDAAGNYGAGKTAAYTWQANLNKELAVLGRSLTQLESVDVRYVAAISLLQPKGTTAWSKGAGGDPFITKIALGSGSAARDALVAHFRDDACEPYVLVQNLVHKGADFPNSGEEAATVHIEFDFAAGGLPGLDRTAIQVLDPSVGVVAARVLTTTGTDTASIDISLRAGAGVLFKYKTAHPFAMK